jgi:hypothetical protein
MSGLYSRNKGKRAEREVRDLFIEHGFPSRRGRQYAGHPDAPDVIVPDLPWLFVESKFVEKLDLHKTMIQAIKDAGDKMPVVFHKKSREGWLVTLSVEDFFELITKKHDEQQNSINHTDHSETPDDAAGEAEDEVRQH